MPDKPAEYPWEATFVTNMTRRRRALGMSQSGLAKALSARGLPFHQPTIQRIETGERPIRLNEAVLIVQVLNMGGQGQLGLDFSVFPDQDESLARFLLAEVVARGRTAVDEAERSHHEAIEHASHATAELLSALHGYERILDRDSDLVPDDELLGQARGALYRWNDYIGNLNAAFHPSEEVDGG